MNKKLLKLKKNLETLGINYRKQWKEKLTESEDIEEYGLNEFIGGKAEGYEEALELLNEYLKPLKSNK
jgi:hypothetical protein